jgi:hypothetical protein
MFRTVITLLALIAYVLVANWHIRQFIEVCKTDACFFVCKVVNIKALVFMAFFCLVDEALGYKSFLHKSLNWIGKFSIALNLLLLLNYYVLWVPDTTVQIKCFNGAIFCVALVLLISGLRHGLFKPEQIES